MKKLAEDQQLRTLTIRVKNQREKQKLLKKLLDYKHFENILLILIKQNYDLHKENKSDNDFALLSNYKVIRALITGTNGGKEKDKIDYIRKKYYQNQLVRELIEQGRELKSHNLAMVIKRIKSNYKSFFTKIKQGETQAKPPKPKKLSQLCQYAVPLDVNAWSFKRKNKVGINLAKKMFYLYLRHEPIVELTGDLQNIQAVSIKLSNGEIYLKISYVYRRLQTQRKNNKYAGIDIGINNLAAIYIDDQKSKSIILSGKPYKHYNATFNRFVAKINRTIEQLEKQREQQEKTENRLEHLKDFRRFLYEKRNRFFEDQFHKMSTRLLEYLQKNEVTDIVISRNLGQLKNNGKCEMRKSSKQSFIQIPFLKFLSNIEYKAFNYGMTLHIVDEAYTSKTSSLTGNILEIQKNAKKKKPEDLTNDFAGNRVKRGLFKDRNLNKYINADLNAAANIVKIGLQRNLDRTENLLFKLSSPIKVSSDRELVCLQINTDSDKVSQGSDVVYYNGYNFIITFYNFNSTVNMNDVVRAAVSLIKNDIDAHTDHLKIEYADNLPTLFGSFQKLEQVIINLVQNACHSLENKEKNISIKIYHDIENNKIKVKVEDEGKGIAKKDLRRISDPFFTTKRDQNGVGLGLAITLNITKQHQGTLDFISEKDKGTIAILSLPVIDS